MVEALLPSYRGDDPYVFVSYAHEDDDLVYPEIGWLQGQGFNVWYDEGIKPGVEWRAALSESIKAAHLVVFFITPRSVLSDHCLREIDLAVDLKKPVLAVYLEPTELPSGTDLTLSRIQGILRYELAKTAYQNALVKGVGEHIERGVARAAESPPQARRRANLLWYVGTAALALLVAGLAVRTLLPDDAPRAAPTPASSVPTRFTIPVPELYLPPFGLPGVAVSPDGGTVVYTAGAMLNIRRMDEFEGRPLPGTRDALAPFFSPDGTSIGFTQNDALRRYSLRTGLITDVVSRVGANFSAHWGDDDSIVYAPVGNVGVFRAAAGGGAPEAITRLDDSSGEITHMWPHLFPGGKAVMYTALGPSGGWEEAEVVVEDRRTGTRKTLVRNASHAAFVAPGHIVYVDIGGNLMVAPFDVDALELSGPAVPMLSGIYRTIWGGGGSYASSGDTLAYVQGDAFKGMRIERIRRAGEVTPFGEPTYGNYLRISPDDARLALAVRGLNNDDIFTYDLATGERRRLTFELAEDETPVWSPDGTRIAYVSAWKGDARRVFVKPSNGSGEAELLRADTGHLHATDWSADGRWLLFDRLPLWDVVAINVDTGEELSVAASSASENEPQFSPDGRWVAFASDESGQAEIYVVSFPDLSVKHQVSRAGGIAPRWVDTNELFYWAGPDLIAVQVGTDDGFEVRGRETIHTDPAMAPKNMLSLAGYDVTSDGQQIFVLKELSEFAPNRIHVVRGWLSEVEGLTAADAP